MNVYKIKQKLIMTEKTISKINQYFTTLEKYFKKYHRGDIEFYVTMVDGDGVVIGYSTPDSSAPSVVIINEIMIAIEKKGYFSDEDLKFNRI